jgi:hypothetical protein
MGIYSDRDLSSSFEGDIVLSGNGDLELASTYESQKAAINFIVRTDKGGYRPDYRLGADLGTFMGERNNKDTATTIEASILQNLTEFVLDGQDVAVHAIPISMDELGVFIEVGGDYMDEDGNLLVIAPEMLTYTFPFLNGEATPHV